MTVTEMMYVLDKEKECIQRRASGDCDKNCTHKCDAYMEASSLLDAFERIVSFIFSVGGHSIRKSY